MKKCLFTSLLLLILLAFGGTSWGLTITVDNKAVDVGAQDKLLDSKDLSNSGDDAEESWVEGILGYDIKLTKNDELTSSDWYNVAGTDVYAFGLQGLPKYFIVKTGNTAPKAKKGDQPESWPTHYFFENTDQLAWAVVNLADINITEIMGVDKISHVDEVNGGVVPEPGTVMLLGAGFLGLAIYGKRRRTTT